jgi:integrase
MHCAPYLRADSEPVGRRCCLRTTAARRTSARRAHALDCRYATVAHRAGVSWIATDYVFTTVAGTPLDPRNVSRWFSALAQRAGVDGSMHATRHTALSSMVSAGVPMSVVSRVAGHESINITVDIYGHVSEQAARDAVAAAASSLGLGRAVRRSLAREASDSPNDSPNEIRSGLR